MLKTGGRYDPVDNSWGARTTLNDAPEGRLSHTAVWTGEHMIVWGGTNAALDVLDTGGRYDPVADLWAATSTTDAPTKRSDHVAVWTGSLMVV